MKMDTSVTLEMVKKFYQIFPSDKTMLWYQDENGEDKLWFEVDTQVVGLKAFSKSSQTGT